MTTAPSQNAAVTHDLMLSTPNAIAPSNTGMIFHKAQSNTLVHDVKHGPDVVIVGIHAGSKEISRPENQTWADVLAGGLAVPTGHAITCVAFNGGQEPKALQIALVVEEQVDVLPANAPPVAVAAAAPVPQKQFGFGTDRAPVRTVTNGQAPANTPFVRRTGSSPSPVQGGAAQGKQTTDVVQNADGTTRKVVRTTLAPIAERSPEIAAQIRANGGSTNARSGGGGGAGARQAPRRGSTVRASGKAPARVNPPRFHGSSGGAAPRSSFANETNGRTRVLRNGGGQLPQNVSRSGMAMSGAPAANVAGPDPGVSNSGVRTVVVMPADGEFTFALIVGHAERLLLRVESNVALPKMFKPSLTRALATANMQPRTAGGNDVVISIQPQDLTTLRQLIIAGGMPLDEGTRERIARAIRRGLAVVRGEVVESTTNVAALVPETHAPQEALAEVEAVIETPAVETSGP